MKAKKLLAVLCTVFAFALCFAFAACNTDKEPEPTPATEYTVTFDANGGTLTGNATVKVESGKTITGAPTAAKEGYDFDAWYTAATDGVKITLTTYTVTQDVTLYAHYTEKTVTPPPPPATTKIEVTFDANGGTLTGENKVAVDEDGLIIDGIPEVTRDGYRFEAWYTQATGGDALDPMFDEVTESITLYAHWIKTYTVTFNAGAGQLVGEGSLTVDEGAKLIGVPSATKSGDEFHGWYTQAEGGDKIDFDTYTVTADATLHAHYGVITMPVKTLKDHEGTTVGYRIEAEEAKAEGTQNSDNNAHPGEFLEDVSNASGGHSLGYLGVVGNKVTFTFSSATAGKATLSVVASSANVQYAQGGPMGFMMWGADQQLTGTEMNMTFNGEGITYEAIMVRGATAEEAAENGGFAFNFRWTSVPVCEVDVVAGLNTFVITVASTTMINIDCLDIQTTLTLTSANGDAATGEATLPAPPAPDVVYEGTVTVDLVIGAYDGGPAVQKAILNFGTQDITKENLTEASFAVGGFGGNTDKLYLCDENGEEVASTVTSSKFVAIEYTPTFNTYGIDGGYSVFNYISDPGINVWKDLSNITVALKGTLSIDGTEYNKMGTNVSFGKKVIPSVDNIWDVTGSYTKGEGEGAITLKYASYGTDAMKNDNVKNALIIWLHGQGEGGTDPTITILGNKVTALATQTVQKYFTVSGGAQGAYVLAPQAPTMWMDYDGNFHRVDAEHKDSYYAETLWELIQQFVIENDDIDTDRIYIGGCSNGGFMTMQMIEKHADYFAAAFPIATPYTSTPELIAAIKDLPIWFTHAKNDTTVSIANYGEGYWDMGSFSWVTPFESYADTNTNAIYVDLLEAGATNVYYSLFEDVNNGVNYMGHYSWIWVFNDEVKYVQATTGAEGAFAITDLDETSKATVTVGENTEATLWAWIAAQSKSA